MVQILRGQARRLAVATGVVVALSATATPLTASATADDDYPPDETVATTTPTTVAVSPTTLARTGSDGIGDMLATGAAFGVAGLGMVVVARRRRQPAT